MNVSTPHPLYEKMKGLWKRSRAVCTGERAVKEFDTVIDIHTFSNMLLPFSPTMSQHQYNFYRAEAGLPGVCAQFSKMLVGGLLRKKPQLSIDTSLKKEIANWIMDDFGEDGASLMAFLSEALAEEIQTSRCWIYVSYPNNDGESNNLKPYPIIYKAEEVINWQVSGNPRMLSKLIIRGTVEDYSANEFHPEYIATTWVHELDENGFYRIRTFVNDAEETVVENIQVAGERLRMIPAWPLNGSIDAIEPVLTPLIDKEISIYNKCSRRNHLLYGAATYTPVITTSMTEERFQDIVDSGLGTWLRLNEGDTAQILETPTEALKNMEEAITNGLEEMAKLGIRMLSPETAQSGIALQLRNAAQTAQLGSLNSRISSTLEQVITFMVYWRYGKDIDSKLITFSLSQDFSSTPLGEQWLKLISEWYRERMIPRSAWLAVLKQNDIIAPDYDDSEGIEEINSDKLLIDKGDDDFANRIK